MTEKIVYNNKFSNGIIGPNIEVLGPVADGGIIIFETTPGCWGPMITPKLQGSHEVNLPVAVEGAKVGDAIAIKVKDITIKSTASSSGTDRAIKGNFIADPRINKKCPKCGATMTRG